jgi:hypothetical protein
VHSREFAKFPVNFGDGGRQFVQQFQSPAGNSLLSAERRVLKQFQQFAGDSLWFAEQGIVSSKQGIFKK